jgi:hypothetical protein
MRVLLTYDGALDDEPGGRALAALAAELQTAGVDVRAIVLTRSAHVARPDVREIVCGTDGPDAELAIAMPTLGAAGEGRIDFADLSDADLHEYRDVLRTTLDSEIDAFEPHVIHAQHLWIQGHLALEAGVPYVVTAWSEELAVCRRDQRYHRFAEQAAENASAIVLSRPTLRTELLATFQHLDEHVLVDTQSTGDRRSIDCVAIYNNVLRSRFGDRVPD